MLSSINNAGNVRDRDSRLGEIGGNDNFSNLRAPPRAKSVLGARARRRNGNPHAMAWHVEYGALILIGNGRVEREDEEIMCPKQVVALERIVEASDRLERGEKDEDGARKVGELGGAKAEIFEKEHYQIKVDGVLIHTLDGSPGPHRVALGDSSR